MKIITCINSCSLFIYILFILSGEAKEITINLNNNCKFHIWPAIASNTGEVIARGGFHLRSGKTKSIQLPGTWSGRIWARTGCDFSTDSYPACETGDCDGQLECNGKIGTPPVTLVELNLQSNKDKPSFYDVSLVDGYNLAVSVSTKPVKSRSCVIGGCVKELKNKCPDELQLVNKKKEVVACRSACLAFKEDKYCCVNEYGSPDKCQPTKYSKTFKEACPSYFSYAFDSPSPLVNCHSDEYEVTFCPSKRDSIDHDQLQYNYVQEDMGMVE
ncbi:thaumatin-like protein [Impatiens glandulifera]|uniref:thaumatin-like protein n=1 Tax=Impatiens glandulifera TaxID=253017 RepID=UPI001FB05DE0|nr:thaumatin-like protein [Impatiens glandulifera]